MPKFSQNAKLSFFISLNLLFNVSLYAQEGNSIAALNNDPIIVVEAPEIKKLRLAVEANMNDLKAHEAYLEAVRKTKQPYRLGNYKDLEDHYDKWISEHPGNAEIPYLLGEFYYRMERPEARKYLLKATELKPDFAVAWFKLGIDAMRLGDNELVLNYLLNASKNDSLNGDYALEYAYSMKTVSRSISDSLLLKVSEKFVNTEAGAKALDELASKERESSRKLAYLVKLSDKFEKSGGTWYRQGMSIYFSLLINTGDYQKALSVANAMNEGVVTNKLEWKHKIEVAKQFQKVEDLLSIKKYLTAEQILKGIKLRDDVSLSYVSAPDKLIEIQAVILNGTGRGETILDTLIDKYTKMPTYQLRRQINLYATQFRKDSTAIYEAISKIWLTKGEQATMFTLTSFNGDKISLADLKGKIVLLTYWFPGCGPCRGEFPHFENVLRNFDRSKIVYLGINALPEQDSYVLPFMKSTGFSFTPLKINLSWDPGNLSASGYPKNYLIDQKGRIIMSGFMIDGNNEEVLELKIRALLAAK